jgi:uncharacterized phage-like protein YoqJ
MSNKIMILLLYYERPNMVRNALKSVLKANEHYKNWFLIAHDDGSENKLEPVVHEVMAGHLDNVGIVRSEKTSEQKVNEGGMLGHTLNEIIHVARAQIKPDILLMLCDDDELHPLYLKKLDEYFTNNHDVMSCYSNVICYDPLHETSENCFPERHAKFSSKLNQWNVSINGTDKVDASQVAWRSSCHDRGVRFPFPCVKNHDSGLFSAMNHFCGPMHYTGFVSQYKGVHSKQLGKVGAYKAWFGKDIDGRFESNDS